MEFGHIGIKVTDIEKSIKFYTEVFGFEIVKDYSYPGARIIFLKGNGTVIELIFKEEYKERSYGPVDHIAFKVENLEDKMKELKALGIEYSEKKVVGNAELIFFEGPDNERFEYVVKKA
jgi:lactoylglutathione lyase